MIAGRWLSVARTKAGADIQSRLPLCSRSVMKVKRIHEIAQDSSDASMAGIVSFTLYAIAGTQIYGAMTR